METKKTYEKVLQTISDAIAKNKVASTLTINARDFNVLLSTRQGDKYETVSYETFTDTQSDRCLEAKCAGALAVIDFLSNGNDGETKEVH